MTYKYDAVINRTRKPSESDPSRQEQKEYMEERLQNLQFDFMPTQSN